MALLLSEDFEGFSPGTVPTTGEDVVAGGDGAATVEYDDTGAPQESMWVTGTSSSNQSYVEHIFASAQTDLHMDLYLQVSSLAANRTVLHIGSQFLISMCQVRVNTNGTLTISNFTTAVATTTSTVSVDTPFRIAVHIDTANDLQTLRLFTGANIHGSTPDDEVSGAYTQGDPNRFRAGAPSSSSFTWGVDGIQADSSEWPMPLVEQDPELGAVAGMGGIAAGCAGNIPSGVVPGDLLIIAAAIANQDPDELVLTDINNNTEAAVAQGWNKFIPRNNGVDVQLHGWWRFAKTGDAGTHIRAIRQPDIAGKCVGFIAAYKGVNALGSINHWTGGHVDATTDHPNPQTTVPSNHAPTIALSFCATKGGTLASDPEIALVKPASMTHRGGAVNGGGGGMAIVIADVEADVSGTYGGGTWVAENSTRHATATSLYLIPGTAQEPPATSGRVKVMRGGVWTGDGEILVL